MKLWFFVFVFGLAAGGFVFYLADEIFGWLVAGFLWGFSTGVFFLRLAVHKYLRPEWYGKKVKYEGGEKC